MKILSDHPTITVNELIKISINDFYDEKFLQDQTISNHFALPAATLQTIVSTKIKCFLKPGLV